MWLVAKEPERAAQAYRSAAEQAQRVPNPMFEIEGFRMAAYCYAQNGQLQPARGGRLHFPDEAQAEPREARVRRGAAALTGDRAAGSPRQGEWRLAAAYARSDRRPWAGGWRVAGAHHALPHGWALQCKAGAGMHHRRASGVDGVDDLLRGDSLQVGAGRGQVRVPQLALDQRQRDALMQQFDSVRMVELVGREAPPDARLNRHLV